MTASKYIATVPAVALFALFVVPQQQGQLKTFQPNTKAKAADVNYNFTVLDDRLKAVDDSIKQLEDNLGNIDGSRLIASSVGSRELAENVAFGRSENSGSVTIRNRSNASKAVLGADSQNGADLWVYDPSGTHVVAYAGGISGKSGGLIQINNGIRGRGISASATANGGGLLTVYDAWERVAVQLQPDGDIYKTGNNGFVHPHPNDPTRQIVYMSIEGPERGTYFRGSGRLRDGTATLVPPEHWRLVTAEGRITVQLTPRGDCRGLFAAEVSRDRIVVRESSRGHSSVEFDYFVCGLRSRFEKHEVYQPNTMFLPRRSVPVSKLGSGNEKAMVHNGILLPDGTVNRALVECLRQRVPAVEPARSVPVK